MPCKRDCRFNITMAHLNHGQCNQCQANEEPVALHSARRCTVFCRCLMWSFLTGFFFVSLVSEDFESRVLFVNLGYIAFTKTRWHASCNVHKFPALFAKHYVRIFANRAWRGVVVIVSVEKNQDNTRQGLTNPAWPQFDYSRCIENCGEKNWNKLLRICNLYLQIAGVQINIVYGIVLYFNWNFLHIIFYSRWNR